MKKFLFLLTIFLLMSPSLLQAMEDKDDNFNASPTISQKNNKNSKNKNGKFNKFFDLFSGDKKSKNNNKGPSENQKPSQQKGVVENIPNSETSHDDIMKSWGFPSEKDENSSKCNISQEEKNGKNNEQAIRKWISGKQRRWTQIASDQFKKLPVEKKSNEAYSIMKKLEKSNSDIDFENMPVKELKDQLKIFRDEFLSTQDNQKKESLFFQITGIEQILNAKEKSDTKAAERKTKIIRTRSGMDWITEGMNRNNSLNPSPDKKPNAN